MGRISTKLSPKMEEIAQPLYSNQSHVHSPLDLHRFPVMQRHVLSRATRNIRALRSVPSTVAISRRAISMSRPSASQLNSLHTFTDEEDMLREAGKRFLAHSSLVCDS